MEHFCHVKTEQLSILCTNLKNNQNLLTQRYYNIVLAINTYRIDQLSYSYNDELEFILGLACVGL